MNLGRILKKLGRYDESWDLYADCREIAMTNYDVQSQKLAEAAMEELKSKTSGSRSNPQKLFIIGFFEMDTKHHQKE